MTTTFKLMISSAAIAVSMAVFVPAAQAYDSIVCGTYAGYAGEKSANYQPGVDARGNAVAPADIAPQMPGMGDVVRIPMTVNMEQRLSQMLPAGVELKAAAGMIDIYRDGRVMYNGVDITTQTKTLCRETPVIEQAPPKKKTVKKAPAPKVEAAPIEETPEPIVQEPVVQDQPVVQEPVAAPQPDAAAPVVEDPAAQVVAPEGEISGAMVDPAAEMPAAEPTPPAELAAPDVLPVPDVPPMVQPESNPDGVTILAPEPLVNPHVPAEPAIPQPIPADETMIPRAPTDDVPVVAPADGF